MGWFTYLCETCKSQFPLSLPKREPKVQCGGCNGEAYPVLKVGSIRNVEVIDNGVMARRVERHIETDQLVEDYIKVQNSKRSGNLPE